MSELQRSFAKAKLAGLPFHPPPPLNEVGDTSTQEDQNYDPNEFEGDDAEDEGEDEVGDLRRVPEQSPDDDSSSASSASSASSTGTIKPSPSKHLFARPRKGLSAASKTFDPLPWNDYFAREIYLKNERSSEIVTHHVYITAPSGKGPLVVTHHGAGSSGLSFALFASELRKIIPSCGILSLDARGHGETVVNTREDASGSIAPELSLQTLSHDLRDIILLTQKEMSWVELPDLLLVGHSLGGAVVTDLAMTGKLGSAVLGYAVLDVVEGSAMDALQSMQSYLSTRPMSFPSIPSAIEWHTRSRTIRNTISARISVPSLLRGDDSSKPSSGRQPWVWRTDLAATQPFWQNWFLGLSHKFLAAKGGKLLLLAGTDRLDKELMIGQMQGKYQLQVFPDAGHFIHEDQAAKTAMVVADFYKRNDRSALVLPPKVGDLIKK